MKPHEYAGFLTSSMNRIRLLKALRSEAEETVGTLGERLSMSRSTVHRSLRTFTDYGWARRVDGAYRLTEAGELVLDAYEELIHTIEWVEEYEEFLTYLGASNETFPIHATRQARMVSATKNDPYRTITYLIDVLTTASTDHLRGMTPILSPLFADAGRELLANGTQVELLASETCLQSATERSNEGRPSSSIDNFDLFRVPDGLPFGVLILDDERVLLSVFDELGNLRACLDGESHDLVEWAETTYEMYRTESQRVETIPDLNR